MRSGLVHLGAWAAATGAAVALSWLGVHAVLADTVFEQPTAVPLPPAAERSPDTSSDAPQPAAETSASASPAQASPSPSASSPAGSPSAPASPTGPATGRPATSSPPTGSTGSTSSVKSYRVPGGRVALDIRTEDAQLVSATPDPGWQMQVWHGDHWMRIDFSQENRTSSVFVTWNGHPPTVQTVPG
ncbi:hypothetical protein [Kitasatospora camelliae]|uniref:Secreted protein n=1 Tax=Kitasatospora camelliae TaxID=3156397 RepID=A0AAU8JU45_9ACTN